MENAEILTDVEVAARDMVGKQRAIFEGIRWGRNDRDSNHDGEVAKELCDSKAIGRSFVRHSKSHEEATRPRRGTRESGRRQQKWEGGIWRERCAESLHSQG